MSPPASFVSVVSGLPRSGTSMMMRMLEASGMPVLADQCRRPDTENTNGYYEFEPVKRIAQDSSWVAHAVGKAVKVVYRLLYDLPPNHHYRVLFMRRNLDEVLASQRKMLVRQGHSVTIEDVHIGELFRGELARMDTWIKTQPCFSVLDVDYNQLMVNSTPIMHRIAEFLEGQVDPIAMKAVIDLRLYRNRI